MEFCARSGHSICLIEKHLLAGLNESPLPPEHPAVQYVLVLREGLTALLESGNGHPSPEHRNQSGVTKRVARGSAALITHRGGEQQ